MAPVWCHTQAGQMRTRLLPLLPSRRCHWGPDAVFTAMQEHTQKFGVRSGMSSAGSSRGRRWGEGTAVQMGAMHRGIGGGGVGSWINTQFW